MKGKVELKYCECCGGLWLRPLGSDEGRCGACAVASEDLASAWAAGLRRRGPQPVRLAELATVQKGGRA